MSSRATGRVKLHHFQSRDSKGHYAMSPGMCPPLLASGPPHGIFTPAGAPVEVDQNLHKWLCAKHSEI